MTSRRVSPVFAPLIAALALLAAGCSAAAPVDSTTAPAVADPATAVTVPDAFTAVTVTAIGAPPLPFRGTDGKFHVVYDLQLTNATKIAATVDQIDVVDGADPDVTVASFSGTALIDPSCTFGDCNRLRDLPAGYIDSAEIPPQASRVVFIDFTVDALA